MVSAAVRVVVLVVAIVVVVVVVVVVVAVVFVVIAGRAGTGGSITGGCGSGDGRLLLLRLEMADELMLVMVTRGRLQVQSVCVVQRGDVVMATDAVVDVGVQLQLLLLQLLVVLLLLLVVRLDGFAKSGGHVCGQQTFVVQRRAQHQRLGRPQLGGRSGHGCRRDRPSSRQVFRCRSYGR